VSLPGPVGARLSAAGLDPDEVERLVRAALAEDLAGGVDVTTVATVPPQQHRVADVVARAPGVVAGIAVAEAAFVAAGSEAGGADDTGAVVTTPVRGDGDRVDPGDVVLTVGGPTVALLTAERTALNLLCHLSGVASLTRRWVDAVAGTGAVVRDTRKTTPLLRALEKYAVRCGGGENHRMSLSDAALVKDNHVLAAGDVAAAYARVRERWPDLEVEVEVDTVADAVAAAAAGAGLVLLDNMTPPQLRTAVRAVAGRARLEASGGLTLATAREVAATGVDYLAVGALTHSAPVLDLGLDLRPDGAGAPAPPFGAAVVPATGVTHPGDR
jgi:nicotinate-nucleotide pyrophosphorylase (carboxylating)